MNPYVFFVGCPRSGTTLLRRIADAHRELAVAPEQHWLPRYWERRIGVEPDGTVTNELAQRLVANRRFARLEIDAERVAKLVDNGRPKHYARFVTEIFDLHGELNRKAFVGEKTPGYVRWLPTLHSLWPHAKVVHLIRDGRDVCLSVLDWRRAESFARRLPTWDESPVATTALWWEWNVRLGREAGARLGPEHYYELRYEALVADPELACRKLCDFLDLQYDAAMLRFHEGKTKSRPGLSAKKAWLPVTRGLRTWRAQMAGGDVARFEAVAGGLLEELGYERAAARLSDKELARIARLRDVFIDYKRRSRVPEAWEDVRA
jgi:hypothetical protein